MAKKRGISFKGGTIARKARGKMAEGIKRSGMSKASAFAIATAAVKRMSKSKRAKTARKR